MGRPGARPRDPASVQVKRRDRVSRRRPSICGSSVSRSSAACVRSTGQDADGAEWPGRSGSVAVRMRILTYALLVLGGWLCDPALAAGGSAAAAVPQPVVVLEAARQQPPVSTIPPLPAPPRFSTIPPLPATPTPIGPTPTSVQVPAPPPTRVVPAIPTPIPVRPAAPPPAPAQAAPRAGGFPIGVALLVFAVSATALGGGLFMLARSRPR